jgi:hypothetical protein
MAKRVHPTREEFEVKEDEVVHTPTKATWIAYSGQAEPHLFRQSMLGSVLANGDASGFDSIARLGRTGHKERTLWLVG